MGKVSLAFSQICGRNPSHSQVLFSVWDHPSLSAGRVGAPAGFIGHVFVEQFFVLQFFSFVFDVDDVSSLLSWDLSTMGVPPRFYVGREVLVMFNCKGVLTLAAARGSVDPFRWEPCLVGYCCTVVLLWILPLLLSDSSIGWFLRSLQCGVNHSLLICWFVIIVILGLN